MEKEMLLETESNIWDDLSHAAKNHNSHFRNVICSTIGISNTPESRIIILRNVQKSLMFLDFFTDKRSDKYQEILRNPKVSMIMYDPENKIQVRIKASAEIFNQDKTALTFYDNLSQQGKKLYGLEFPPGKTGEINIQEKASYSEKRAIENFSIIRTRINEIDYLNLENPYHKRARFHYENSKLTAANWVMP